MRLTGHVGSGAMTKAGKNIRGRLARGRFVAQARRTKSGGYRQQRGNGKYWGDERRVATHAPVTDGEGKLLLRPKVFKPGSDQKEDWGNRPFGRQAKNTTTGVREKRKSLKPKVEKKATETCEKRCLTFGGHSRRGREENCRRE